MALQAQGADVLEIAFAAAFHHRNDMVGIPKAFPGAGAESPIEKSFQPRRAAQAFQLPLCMQAIDAATGADAAIAFQYLFAKIARVGAQAPFLHAPSRTKRHAALGNFQIAPAAEIAAIGTFGKACRSAQPPGMVLLVLILLVTDSSFQKIAKTEQDRAGTHLSVSGEGVRRRLRPRLRFGILRNCTDSSN